MEGPKSDGVKGLWIALVVFVAIVLIAIVNPTVNKMTGNSPQVRSSAVEYTVEQTSPTKIKVTATPVPATVPPPGKVVPMFDQERVKEMTGRIRANLGITSHKDKVEFATVFRYANPYRYPIIVTLVQKTAKTPERITEYPLAACGDRDKNDSMDKAVSIPYKEDKEGNLYIEFATRPAGQDSDKNEWHIAYRAPH
jgi:archaellin